MASTTKTSKRSAASRGVAAVKGAARKVASKATPSKKAPATTTTATKAAPAKKATLKKAPAAKKAAPAKKATAKKSPAAKKTTATKAAPVKKATAKKAAPVKKATAKKAAPVKKATAKKAAPVKKATAKKAAPVKKATAKKTPAKGAAKRPRTTGAPRTVTNPTTTGSLAVKADEAPWSADEISEVRAALEADRTRLLDEIQVAERGLADLLSGGVDGAGNDQADVGSTSLERDAEMSLAANHRELLLQVEKALARIEAGTYGNCEICGQPIGKMRLMAFPRATLCMTCKQREERR
ncbi:TraR/DksA C4-type zinc finger protein [Mumia sp. zg.B17]|uniref:TraR/DksA family transcriptional regulator n=1 Tax=Mumia sp. zg.B17 TaxID=2855446 RepID=UPI001C6E8D7A|nr:TraR/DksA C4-type zinc finger protein [Mumia sp. zg.B17]MBW9206223.1 TraR/DksA C4-type zinc finger protein [Mumia sp. zg.B17]